jgi:hypothetical protein
MQESYEGLGGIKILKDSNGGQISCSKTPKNFWGRSPFYRRQRKLAVWTRKMWSDPWPDQTVRGTEAPVETRPEPSIEKMFHQAFSLRSVPDLV